MGGDRGAAQIARMSVSEENRPGQSWSTATDRPRRLSQSPKTPLPVASPLLNTTRPSAATTRETKQEDHANILLLLLLLLARRRRPP